ncbi:hypothetical protein BGL59_04045 [Helicobacter pylori]|nr:hypothetical protein BGL59_04045 [Helicobacter pylori]
MGSEFSISSISLFKFFPNTRYMPHATNHKSTTTTEKIKCAIARNPLNIKYWSVSFFLFVKGVIG